MTYAPQQPPPWPSASELRMPSPGGSNISVPTSSGACLLQPEPITPVQLEPAFATTARTLSSEGAPTAAQQKAILASMPERTNVQPSGLWNRDNRCFVNSVAQCVYQIHGSFGKAAAGAFWASVPPEATNEERLASAVMSLNKAWEEAKGGVVFGDDARAKVIPEALKCAFPHFVPRRQFDADEFLRALLSGIANAIWRSQAGNVTRLL